MVDQRALQQLDERLDRANMEGAWSQSSPEDRATYSKDPHTTVLPTVWKWQDIYESIQIAGNMYGLEGMAERRVLRLVNPAFKGLNRRRRATTHTMLTTIQLLKPGEVASSHRHNFAAFRFILKGKGAYTVVEGEKIDMEEGDLILTPSGTWHGHANQEEPVIWLDGLDNPLLFSLQVITWEPYPGEFQPLNHPSENTSNRVGSARPVWEKPEQRTAYNLSYKWRDIYPTLQNLRDTEGSPFDGIALEYVNPAGGHTMPTMACGIQLLRPGEVTKTHRHNSTTVFQAFRGAGTATINGERFDWEQGDCFVVPLWSWHSHENRSASDEAILFSMTDQPVLEALKLYREEPRED